MSELFDNLKRNFLAANWLNRLIYINLGVFVIYVVLGALSFIIGTPLDGYFQQFMSLPNDLQELIYRPWTLITYMFTHYAFTHIFFNLIVLYFSGRIFLDFLGDKRILPVYFFGGLAGAIAYILIYNLSGNLEVGGSMIGASAGVMAVMVAAATKVPNLPVRLFFVLEAKLWWIAAGYVVLDISGISGGNTGGHLAHLGGALVGYLYVNSLERNRDWSNFFWDFSRSVGGLFKRKPKMKTVHRKSWSERSSSRPTPAHQSNEQAKMDAILDKIKLHGYDKLTKEEKDFLFQFSRK